MKRVSADRGAVVVTGSSTGIGRASALELARIGFTVYAGVRRAEDGERLRSDAVKRLEPVLLDVTDAETIAATADRVRVETGGRLAGLVNNAGIAVSGPVEGLELDDLRRQLEVNVVGQVAVTQAFLPMLREARGRVVFMSSIGGRGGIGFLSPYNASKSAISAIGDSLRQEMRPFGVEVSIIEPGPIATEIWSKGIEHAPTQREELGPELLALYGERLEKLESLARKADAAGLDPSEVADIVAHALTASRPKTRYLVGRDAKAQAAARSLLPARAFDRAVERELDRA